MRFLLVISNTTTDHHYKFYTNYLDNGVHFGMIKFEWITITPADLANNL